MNPPRFKLITVDLDDTVWPCAPVIQAAENALLSWLEQRAPRLTEMHDQRSLREHRLALMRSRPEIAHDLGRVRRLSIATLLEEHGHGAEDAGALAHDALAVFMAHRMRVEPYADVGPALRRLAVRHHLISLTNGNADPEQTDLRGLFAHRVNAAGTGAAKPDAAMFERALALAGCTPGQALHVGDEPYLDVQAARCLGMEAVWVNRYDRVWPDDLPPPALTVTDLHQLADWLDPQPSQGTGHPGDTGGV
jgi:FMN hydrolase / 5-amino-6-(5-phospho-D-ribitylamino)uracil phosphatase